MPGIMRTHLDRRDIQSCEGSRVTSRPRTVVDCLRMLPQAAALDLLDRALQSGWITLDDLVARVGLLVGCPGAPRLVRLVRAASGGSCSAAERLAAQLLRRAGIVGWSANVEIRDERGLIGVGDVVFEDVKLVIELDGWAFHATPDRFQRDRRRQNRLIAAGWTVLRFTWRDLVERPEQVITTIRTVLAQLSCRTR